MKLQTSAFNRTDSTGNAGLLFPQALERRSEVIDSVTALELARREVAASVERSPVRIWAGNAFRKELSR